MSQNNKEIQFSGRSVDDVLMDLEPLLLLPQIYYELSAMIAAGQSSSENIAYVISRDSTTSDQLLKIANCPIYGYPAQIDSMSDAVVIIGAPGLRELILAASALSAFSSFQTRGIDKIGFWRHSLLCAIMARLLARRLRIPYVEPVFVSGLLHDVGWLVLGLYATDTDVSDNFCHAEMAAELLRRWSFSEAIVEPIACHHDAIKARRYPLHATAMQIANLVVSGRIDETPKAVLALTDLHICELPAFLMQAMSQLDGASEAFLIEVA